MRDATPAPSTADFAGEMSAWMAGGGILTMMLFPLALPLIALLAISALPLVVLAVAAAVVGAPVMLAVALGRRAVRAMRRGRSPERVDADDAPGAGGHRPVAPRPG